MKEETTDLTDKIIRSKRRTIALIINEDAELEIRAPKRASLVAIERFVAEKQSWIKKKKELMKSIRARIKPKMFVDGEMFLFEGDNYQLQSCEHEEITICNEACALYLPKKLLPKAPVHLTAWYKTKALEKISVRTNHHANNLQLEYKTIRLSNAKTSWGSCSHSGALRINWRLIMAPPDVLDYIIIHELIHLIEKNHSKRFWGKVQTVLPNYKEQDLWLKQNRHALIL